MYNKHLTPVRTVLFFIRGHPLSCNIRRNSCITAARDRDLRDDRVVARGWSARAHVCVYRPTASRPVRDGVMVVVVVVMEAPVRRYAAKNKLFRTVIVVRWSLLGDAFTCPCSNVGPARFRRRACRCIRTGTRSGPPSISAAGVGGARRVSFSYTTVRSGLLPKSPSYRVCVWRSANDNARAIARII